MNPSPSFHHRHYHQSSIIPSSEASKVASRASSLGIPEEGVDQRGGNELASNSKPQQGPILLRDDPLLIHLKPSTHAQTKNPIRTDSADAAGETIPRYHCAIDNATLSGP